MCNEQKLLISLLNKVQSKGLVGAVKQMWKEGLLDRKALERLYISMEVERRVRNGEIKTRVFEQLSTELGCSYEKVRAAAYHKNKFLRTTNGNTN